MLAILAMLAGFHVLEQARKAQSEKGLAFGVERYVLTISASLKVDLYSATVDTVAEAPSLDFSWIRSLINGCS